MKLTWRDAIATLLTAAIVVMAVAVTAEWGWPFLGSVRIGTLTIGVVGLATCIVGGTAMTGETAQDSLRSIPATLGALAFVLVLAGAITGSSAFLIALVADIAVLWIVTTVRHAMGLPRRGGRPAHVS